MHKETEILLCVNLFTCINTKSSTYPVLCSGISSGKQQFLHNHHMFILDSIQHSCKSLLHVMEKGSHLQYADDCHRSITHIIMCNYLHLLVVTIAMSGQHMHTSQPQGHLLCAVNITSHQGSIANHVCNTCLKNS